MIKMKYYVNLIYNIKKLQKLDLQSWTSWVMSNKCLMKQIINVNENETTINIVQICWWNSLL